MSIENRILLLPNEKIVAVLRRVIIVDGGHYFLAGVFLLLPFFFLFPLLRWRPWGLIVGGLLFLLGILVLVRTIFLWWHNMFIITTERLIDIDQRGFFDRVVSQSPFVKVQDISYHIHGMCGTFFRYGDINIKWASGAVALHVPDIYRPAKAHRLMLDVQKEYLERHADEHLPPSYEE